MGGYSSLGELSVHFRQRPICRFVTTKFLAKDYIFDAYDNYDVKGIYVYGIRVPSHLGQWGNVILPTNII